jgi:hypothetical protein
MTINSIVFSYGLIASSFVSSLSSNSFDKSEKYQLSFFCTSFLGELSPRGSYIWCTIMSVSCPKSDFEGFLSKCDYPLDADVVP